jgi:hypothetical protein
MTAWAIAHSVTILGTVALCAVLMHHGEPWGWGLLLLLAAPSLKQRHPK